MVWTGICHNGRTQLKVFQGKYRYDILDPIVLLFLQQRNMTMQNVTWLVFVKTVCDKREWHPCSSLAGIVTGSVTNWTLNVYWINSVDVFATVTFHQRHYRNCVTHLCRSRTTPHTPLSNDWSVLRVGDAQLSLLQEVVTHVTEFRNPPYCITIYVCPWMFW